MRNLPQQTVAIEVPHFEHLDFLWAQDVDKLVFPHVLEALKYYTFNRNATGLPRGLLASITDTGHSTHRRNLSADTAWSEDEVTNSDLDLATPKRKSHAQIRRDRQYVKHSTPVSPTAHWNEQPGNPSPDPQYELSESIQPQQNGTLDSGPEHPITPRIDQATPARKNSINHDDRHHTPGSGRSSPHPVLGSKGFSVGVSRPSTATTTMPALDS